jgi:transposase-like protein
MIEGTEEGRRPTGVPSIKRAEKDTITMQNKIRKRRKLPAEKKYAILEEVRQNAGTKAEILRREGLYSADLHRFDQIAREGAILALSKSRPGRKKKIEQEITPEGYEALKRELSRKEKALAELAIEFTILKKKVNGE